VPEVRFVVTNDHNESVRVVVEPLGDFVDLAAGESIGVICSEAANGYVNIVSTESQSRCGRKGSRGPTFGWIVQSTPPRPDSAALIDQGRRNASS